MSNPGSSAVALSSSHVHDRSSRRHRPRPPEGVGHRTRARLLRRRARLRAATADGGPAAFISAGDYHHHIGLNTWESRGGGPPPRGTTGLYHTAIRYPDREQLADALARLVEAGIPLTGASDHGVSEALYLNDPDGNGVELYRDRPREEWPLDPDGGVAIISIPLDVDALLREAPKRA
jgi:catechol 2,3-dioxygenase